MLPLSFILAQKGNLLTSLKGNRRLKMSYLWTSQNCWYQQTRQGPIRPKSSSLFLLTQLGHNSNIYNSSILNKISSTSYYNIQTFKRPILVVETMCPSVDSLCCSIPPNWKMYTRNIHPTTSSATGLRLAIERESWFTCIT